MDNLATVNLKKDLPPKKGAEDALIFQADMEPM
jgi:hypothetical protein